MVIYLTREARFGFEVVNLGNEVSSFRRLVFRRWGGVEAAPGGTTLHYARPRARNLVGSPATDLTCSSFPQDETNGSEIRYEAFRCPSQTSQKFGCSCSSYACFYAFPCLANDVRVARSIRSGTEVRV